jgi:tRNA-2-methylthio-N6-dimethylallyladenosine synthase
VTPEALRAQEDAAERVSAMAGRPETYHIVTYGCQMNAHDSETLAGLLESMGLREAADRADADLVLFNTCCVRENAERRALGNVNWLKELKKGRPSMIIGVCGCMVQQSAMVQKILKQYPFVDIAFGTHNQHELPQMLESLLTGGTRQVSLAAQEDMIAEGLPVKRMSGFKAFITIMYGCNNFCSYCIVPYVRGRERSRRMDDILREAEELLAGGVKEIMLLGQNVNSYGDGGAETFPRLLTALDRLGVPRIRFMTSHPKDLSDGLIQAMADGRHILNHLHLPVQSGSDEILSAMNRRYTRESYLAKVAALRNAIPDIGLTTDLIVGFPGETETQFAETVSLVDAVGYDAAFTFIYSPRDGTQAATLPGQLPPEVTGARIAALIRAVERSAERAHEAMLGKTEQVLVEGVSKRGGGMVSGKGTRGITIALPGTEADIGQIIPVHITSSATNTLRGTRL